MLIGICGSICSGKKSVAQYLIEHHGFKLLQFKPQSGEASDETTSPSAGASARTDPSSATRTEAIDAGDVAANNEENFEAGRSLDLRPGSGAGPGLEGPLVFESPEQLLEYATRHWRDCFVTTSITSEKALDVLARRPFFLLVSVDAPLTVRWRRFQQRSNQPGDSAISLEEFVTRNDRHQYNPSAGLQPLISRATVRLLNTSSSVADLFAALGKLNIPNPDRLRPSWDSYFMSLASLAAHRSNCMKRRVGCVLVGQEHRVISTGYNGTPRGLRNCAEGGCPRCNEGSSSGVGLSTCLCLHAEENALLEAGRERIREGCILYCDTCPCLTCSIKICQVGIREVVFAHQYSMDKETAEVFKQAGVKLRQFIPPPNGLIDLKKELESLESD